MTMETALQTGLKFGLVVNLDSGWDFKRRKNIVKLRLTTSRLRQTRKPNVFTVSTSVSVDTRQDNSQMKAKEHLKCVFEFVQHTGTRRKLVSA